jgi:hypothetical protein
MSFGFSVGDFVLLTQLAWSTVQNARRACGAHDELTREVTSLHRVLQRLETEALKPESLLKGDDNRQEELADLVRGCGKVLQTLSKVLEKYNALSEEKRKVTKLWQRVRFGNGEMLDLSQIRLELSTHTNALNLFLNLLLLGSQGRVERHMDSHSLELKEIRQSVNWISSSMQAKTKEGSIWTSYADDDKAFWRTFRRELVKEGFSSVFLRKHKSIIKEYLTELGSRGAFDDVIENESVHSPPLEERFGDQISLSEAVPPKADEPALLSTDSPGPTPSVYQEEPPVPPKADKPGLLSTKSPSPALSVYKEESPVPPKTDESGLLSTDSPSPNPSVYQEGSPVPLETDEPDLLSRDSPSPNPSVYQEESPGNESPKPCESKSTDIGITESVTHSKLPPPPSPSPDLDPRSFQFVVMAPLPHVQATEVDARKHHIPTGYSLKYWNPAEEPITLLNNVFDANSLGWWIYNWTVYRHGAGPPTSTIALELWTTLRELTRGIRRAKECIPRIKAEDHRVRVEKVIESGDHLIDELKGILKACETPILKASKKYGTQQAQVGNDGGTEFVKSMLNFSQGLENTKKFINSVQLWNDQFSANCQEILRQT